ncbi:hypothetical protein, partial [Salmonella enterica]
VQERQEGLNGRGRNNGISREESRGLWTLNQELARQ